MRSKSAYIIPFGGLKPGEHSFRFAIDSALFSLYPEGEIKDGKGEIDILLNKHAGFLELNVKIAGEVIVLCDRCLDDLALPVDFESKLIVKLSSEIDEPEFELNQEEEDIIWINASDTQIDLIQYIYDSINLALPYTRAHGTDAQGYSLCDPDMLKRFTRDNA